ncbi:MAG TPA: thiamine-phosphate kinase [Candidatus Angelobacter sp.]
MIERIRWLAKKNGRGTLIHGIGDDCAILHVPRSRQLLATTDLSIEDVHFRRKWHSARSVGHRCLARGLSDIAAMGGEPLACFLSLGVPPRLRQKWVDEFLRGLLALAHRFKIPLAGGDTSSAQKITADILVLGTVPRGKALLRSGARPDDRIYVTGKLGGSAAVLKRLYAGEKPDAAKARSHFYPEPRIELARRLRELKLATAMIDLSDGLSVDLAHICQESRVSAVIEAKAIPIASGAMLDLALHGGEDYELLFTASAKAEVPAEIAGVRVTHIGNTLPRSSRASLIQIRDAMGHTKPVEQAGWQHFAKNITSR